MPYRNDKVRDVVAVLEVMRNEFRKTSEYCSSTELRKGAVKEIAEAELQERRYKNQDSAFKTIHDACARRLRPQLSNIRDFDRLADHWLRQNSMKLKDVLLSHSESPSQRATVTEFFEDKS